MAKEKWQFLLLIDTDPYSIVYGLINDSLEVNGNIN